MTKIQQMRKLVSELHEIKKRPLHYAALDLHNWMETKLDEVGYLLDEIENEMDSEYPDGQMELNAELDLVEVR